MADTTSNVYFALYDFFNKTPRSHRGGGRFLGTWDNLTGGDMNISNIAYKVISEAGHATTKYIPGMTTFAAVQLLRAMDKGSKEVYERFEMASYLNLKVRSNYSVAMLDRDKPGHISVYWHLINAIPITIDGFSFNVHTGENYTTFEITLQPEYIELEFPLI